MRPEFDAEPKDLVSARGVDVGPVGERPGQHRPLLGRIYRWLRPGGTLLFITGETEYTGTQENWLGSNAKMYWSHADGGTYA